MSFRIFILTVFILIARESFSQKLEFGLSSFASGYLGDINSTNLFYYKNFGAGIIGKYNFNPTWSLRLDLNQIKLSADDKDFVANRQRNLSFRNSISELSAMAEFNFFTLKPNKKRIKSSPYLIAGLGVIKHSPYVNYYGQKVFLRKLELENDAEGTPINYTALALIIPLGLGFKYNFKGAWTVAIECNYRTVLSDRIDNVGGYYSVDNYPQKHYPTNPIKRTNGSTDKFNNEDWLFLTDPSNNYPKNIRTLRGDAKKWDGYMTAGFTLTYAIKSSKCTWYN